MNTDTSEDIYNKQNSIFLSKPLESRFKMGLEMIDEGVLLLKSGIELSNPGISNINLKVEMFKRLYENDFSNKELTEIISFFKSKQ